MTFKPDIRKISLCILGSGILAFGLYNIHSLSGVTEGGILGMMLFLQHWFKISPAISGFIMNAFCYLLGCRLLGKKFIFYSVISSGSFSIFFALLEKTTPLWPQLADKPFIAALAGALFVGVGAGLCVRAGGAPSGDDALAMSVQKKATCDIRWPYLFSDLFVLLLSLSYLDLRRILLSTLTVLLSGQLIGIVQTAKRPYRQTHEKTTQET